MMNIANNLIYLRKANKLTIEDVADKINVSRQAISKWENGNSMPDIINCAALAKLYHVSVDDLIYFDGKKLGISPKGKYFFGTTKITADNQLTIPQKVQRIYHFSAGTEVVLLGNEEGVAVLPAKKFLDQAQQILTNYYPKSN
ncbi:helix-turn-helix transcriptional regulator [Limosilactobacillus sp.]|uniref:helix-turn-helix transcriptional regulator n=1 Tax=Limosilactobacillus sp. TaxID=2773925 RepID=UPI0035A0760D